MYDKKDDAELFEKGAELVFENNQVENEILKTNKDKCTVCTIGDLKSEGKPTPMVVYGRNGAKVHPHQYIKFNNSIYS